MSSVHRIKKTKNIQTISIHQNKLSVCSARVGGQEEETSFTANSPLKTVINAALYKVTGAQKLK